MDPVRRSQRRTLVLVVAVFVLGVLVGGLGTRAVLERRLRALVTGDPAVLRNQLLLRALDRRLRLTEAQRAEAARTLDAQSGAYREAIAPCRPQVRALRRQMARDLSPALDPTQRTALEGLVLEGERFR
jgi:hypothetical protein